MLRGIKEGLSNLIGGRDTTETDYIEVDLGQDKQRSKVFVRLFVLKRFEDVVPILDALREGYTIAIIDIKPLKAKDIIELKRAVSKIKKTSDALQGNIGGFGENIIIVTPQFAEIQKQFALEEKPKDKRDIMNEMPM